MNGGRQSILAVATQPFDDQRPGTSGLRRKVDVFRRPHYLENFIQSSFDALALAPGSMLVVGGDGRYHNAEALQVVLRMAAANGIGRVVVGRDGLLSTPATSILIRKRRAAAGIILSASHNPGGPHGDFGVKVNTANGGPAPPAVTESIFAHSRSVQRYLTVDTPDVPLDRIGTSVLGGMAIEVVDPVSDYASCMESLFDFASLRSLFASGFRIRFDAMHGVTGPYAVEILENRLGAPAGSVVRGEPRPDFGGEPPDPNLAHARELAAAMARADAPDLGAACDGDGDRNMILGRRLFVTPSDSLAVIADHARFVPGYSGGLAGIARSMPTSRAVDRVAERLGIPCYEVPTGWKYFGALLDAGKITLCGEESFGTGSRHAREKDGLWAVLFWLGILAVRARPVEVVVREHWRTYGRHFYARHDYEELDAGAAESLMDALRTKLPQLHGTELAGRRVLCADDFRYVDPVDGAVSENQGLRIELDDASRIVFRLSGTGSEGATLRLYVEAYEADPSRQLHESAQVLSSLASAAAAVADIEARTGRQAPDVVT